MLAQCSSVEKSFFVENMKPVLFMAGDVIIQEGEVGEFVYFIRSGEVSISLKYSKA